MTCQAKLQSGAPCPYGINKDDHTKRFCKRHIHLNIYTDDELANSRKCSGCCNWKIIEPEYNICAQCRQRGATNRENAKREKPLMPQCDACVANRSKRIYDGINTNSYGKNYCNLHNDTHTWFDKLSANNRKPCANYNRKCLTKDGLPKDFDEEYCNVCSDKLLAKSRQYEKGRILKRHNAADTKGMCNRCFESYDDPNEFIDHMGNETKKCKKCREKHRLRDRDSRARGVKKAYPLSEASKQKKMQWRKDNYERTAAYCYRYRAKMMKQKGDQYWIEKAQYAAEWRKRNPEKVKQSNIDKKGSLIAKLGYYKHRASNSAIEWSLTDEEVFEWFKASCHYCGIEPGDSNNGIDRIDSSLGYINGNIVTCCEMCNMMKGSISDNILIERARAILAYNGVIDDEYACTYAFPLQTCVPHNEYVIAAERRNIAFHLTENQYYDNINKPCYLCGTETYYRSINGIDRVSSHGDYELENTRSCCSQCNYLKREYDYDTFIDKLLMIHEHSQPLKYEQNKIHINKDMLVLYAYNKTNNCFVRTDHIIENADLGSWVVDCIPGQNMFSMRAEKCYDNTYQESYIINSGICRMPYLALSQSHNRYIRVDPKEEFSVGNIGNERFMSILNNCTVIGTNYHNSHKLRLNIKKCREYVIGIEISYDSDQIRKFDRPCKCDLCDYDEEIRMDHACHPVLDKCYWCSESGEYYGDDIQSTISITPNGLCNSCANVSDEVCVNSMATTRSHIIRYKNINNAKKSDLSLRSIIRHKRDKKTKEEIKLIGKRKRKKQKQTMIQNYSDEQWVSDRIQKYVSNR